MKIQQRCCALCDYIAHRRKLSNKMCNKAFCKLLLAPTEMSQGGFFFKHKPSTESLAYLKNHEQHLHIQSSYA